MTDLSDYPNRFESAYHARLWTRGKIGVVHGRFQPFHLDHLRYALAAKENCDHLIVGITNPDPGLSTHDNTDPNRSLNSSNPLSFYERLTIVRECLLEAGVSHEAFDIVPFPINRPELIGCYVPSNAVFFMTIYDDWGVRKRDLLKSIGLDVVTLWHKQIDEKIISGTDIRLRIATGQNWEHLVPNAAVQLIKDLGLQTKFSQASSQDGEFIL